MLKINHLILSKSSLNDHSPFVPPKIIKNKKKDGVMN